MVGSREDDRKAQKAALSMLFAAIILGPAAAKENTEFFSQCQILLPAADKFEVECTKNAVPFGRTFYPSGQGDGEAESFRVLFSNYRGNSQFILGCVISGNPMTAHVNLYYKTTSAPLPPLTKEKIKYVDFNNNVGLLINGKRVVLLAIRQVVTPKIKEGLPGVPRNCDQGSINKGLPSEENPTMEPVEGSDSLFKYCYSNAYPCEIEKYHSSFGRPGGNITFSPAYKLFIDDNGKLIVRDEYRKEACKSWKDIYSDSAIILDTCE